MNRKVKRIDIGKMPYKEADKYMEKLIERLYPKSKLVRIFMKIRKYIPFP